MSFTSSPESATSRRSSKKTISPSPQLKSSTTAPDLAQIQQQSKLRPQKTLHRTMAPPNSRISLLQKKQLGTRNKTSLTSSINSSRILAAYQCKAHQIPGIWAQLPGSRSREWSSPLLRALSPEQIATRVASDRQDRLLPPKQ